MMMNHRHWCSFCRSVTVVTNEESPEAMAGRSQSCPKCSSVASYLESVPAPSDDPSADVSEPTSAQPRKPPSRQEWYDAGYAAGTYERRFAGPEWLPCWSDPTYVATRVRINEDGSLEPVSSLGAPGMQSGESFDDGDWRLRELRPAGEVDKLIDDDEPVRP